MNNESLEKSKDIYVFEFITDKENRQQKCTSIKREMYSRDKHDGVKSYAYMA